MREKIIALFEYRQLPELIKYGGRELDEVFYEKLINLQFHIYKLDHELERNWKVDPSVIEDRWKQIYEALSDLGIPQKLHDKFCRHIYKYQKHELELRKGKLPTRLSMEYFYFYKSCDVKLLRKIIYIQNPNLAKAIKESDWRLFDLVTEINDDIDDLQEDTQTINGNRFLISLKQFGFEKTKATFTAFINEIDQRNNEQEVSIGSINVSAWTKTQVNETLNLISLQLTTLNTLDTSKYDQIVARKVLSS